MTLLFIYAAVALLFSFLCSIAEAVLLSVNVPSIALLEKNGKPAGVLITPEDFDQVQQHRQVLAAIQEGLDDVAAGRVFDDADLDAELDSELGPL